MYRATVQLILEDNTIIQGSAVVQSNSTNLYGDLVDYFIEEEWIDGQKIVDFEMKSTQWFEDYGRGHLIIPPRTYKEDKEIYGDKWFPFIRVKKFDYDKYETTGAI